MQTRIATGVSREHSATACRASSKRSCPGPEQSDTKPNNSRVLYAKQWVLGLLQLELTRRTAATAAGGGLVHDVPILHAENLATNVKSINYSRTFLSIISGVVARIWGFTGLTGFVFYFLVMMVGSLGLLMKAKFLVHSYYSWSRILIEGVLGGLMSFVLFWAFAYDIVHIF